MKRSGSYTLLPNLTLVPSLADTRATPNQFVEQFDSA
jgi:hypothetical protein